LIISDLIAIFAFQLVFPSGLNGSTKPDGWSDWEYPGAYLSSGMLLILWFLFFCAAVILLTLLHYATSH
jgi:hypothetical protein